MLLFNREVESALLDLLLNGDTGLRNLPQAQHPLLNIGVLLLVPVLWLLWLIEPLPQLLLLLLLVEPILDACPTIPIHDLGLVKLLVPEGGCARQFLLLLFFFRVNGLCQGSLYRRSSI